VTPTSKTGRRPGNSGTREAILAAARRQFADLGYDRTSIRQIAIEAGVDPGLVRHFHGTKQELFVAVVELPFNPADAISLLLSGDPDSMGLRLARFLLDALERDSPGNSVVSIVRAAASEPAAAVMVREFVTANVLAPLTAAIGADNPALRASLLGSQTVGLTFARYVVGIEPLASLPKDKAAAAIAPTLQHYLTGDLGTSVE
jgi:AcrR family transcriptional regulator